ncbi:hypothetical protein GCM10009095_32600 [Sphingomonas molluscorum]|nr:hypothetical protein GCM10017606_30580 [Microbacterium terregens]
MSCAAAQSCRSRSEQPAVWVGVGVGVGVGLGAGVVTDPPKTPPSLPPQADSNASTLNAKPHRECFIISPRFPTD